MIKLMNKANFGNKFWHNNNDSPIIHGESMPSSLQGNCKYTAPGNIS